MKIETKINSGFKWKYFYINNKLKKVVNLTLKKIQEKDIQQRHRRWGIYDGENKRHIPE